MSDSIVREIKTAWAMPPDRCRCQVCTRWPDLRRSRRVGLIVKLAGFAFAVAFTVLAAAAGWLR